MSKRVRMATASAGDDAARGGSLGGPSSLGPPISAADVPVLSLQPTHEELCKMQSVLDALGKKYITALEDAAQALQGIDAVVAQLRAVPVETPLLEALELPNDLAKTAQSVYKKGTAFFKGEHGRRLTIKAMAPLKSVVDSWRILAQRSKLASPQWEQSEEDSGSRSELRRAVAAAVAEAVAEAVQTKEEEFQRQREEDDRFFVPTGNEHRDNVIKVLAMTLFTATTPFEAGVELERILYLRYCCMDKDGELTDAYLQRVRLIWKHLSPKVRHPTR